MLTTRFAATSTRVHTNIGTFLSLTKRHTAYINTPNRMAYCTKTPRSEYNPNGKSNGTSSSLPTASKRNSMIKNAGKSTAVFVAR